MKKVHKIFIGLILIEIIVIIPTLLYGDSCGSLCDPHSIFNPFGVEDQTTKFCPSVCFWRPHNLFYLIFDILLLTATLYIFTLIISKKFKHKKKYQKLKNK